MKFFDNIVDGVYGIINLYKQIQLDDKNRKIFLRTIEEETADSQSKFAKLNFKLGDDRESLVCVTMVPDNFQNSGNDYMIYDRLNENTMFLTDFLKGEVGFQQYVSLPEYYHIEDPSTDNVSMNYLAVWRFNPMVKDSVKYKALAWLYGVPSVIVAVIVGALLF